MARNETNLFKALPAPVNETNGRNKQQPSNQVASPAVINIPRYGHRQGYKPIKPEDFGGGGAFPEIHMNQFPFGTSKTSLTNNAIARQIDAEGKIDYTALVRNGQRSDKIIYSKPSDLLPQSADIINSLVRPHEDDLKESMDATNAALQRIVAEKHNIAQTVKRAEKLGKPEYIRYTPAQQGAAFNSGSKQLILKIQEEQVDPLEPPKHRTNKKIPRAEPSPPAPVLHSPTRKVTVEERKNFTIPPCVPNWENKKGFTIPLPNRIAAGGLGLQQITRSDKFEIVSRVLEMAEARGREETNLKRQMEMKIQRIENEQRELKLQMLAKEAKLTRSGIREEHDEDAKIRNEERKRNEKERKYNKNIARANPEKRKMIERPRDIGDKIALGLADAGSHNNNIYDQRLFNQSSGVNPGFGGGNDERYDVYDTPWNMGRGGIANNLYRAPRNIDGSSGVRDPVQFEKDDPFELDKLFEDVRRGQKRKGSPDNNKQESSKTSKKR